MCVCIYIYTHTHIWQIGYPKAVLVILTGSGILSVLELLSCWDAYEAYNGDKLCITTKGVNVEEGITEIKTMSL